LALPFAAIVLFFLLADRYGFYPVPIRIRPGSDDLVSLLAPLVVVERGKWTVLISFYHIPIAPLIMGCAMLLAARRLHIMAILVLGVVLAFCRPFFGVSPVMWLAMPVLCCSIMVGAGMQGLVLAGYSDRKWPLAAALVMSGLAIAALLLASKYFQFFLSLADKYARLFVLTAWMHILGAIALMILFFIARAKLRLTPVRWAILSAATAIDILLSARFVLDRVL